MITTTKTFSIKHLISYSLVFLLFDSLQETQKECQSSIPSLTELLQLQLFQILREEMAKI